MNRYLVTWNSGGTWMLPNVRASHIDATRRWGVEFLEIDKLTLSPFADKAKLLNRIEGDQVMWIDGDAIIRHDCPSLFDIVPVGTFAGVPNFQGDTHGGDPWKWHERDWGWCVMEYKRMDIFYDPKTFVNGGMMVFTPSVHREIWGVDYPAQPNAEQTLMNFRADMLGVTRMTLAPTFNRIGEAAWQTGPMRYFIQHMAAFGWGAVRRSRSDRNEILREIDWTQAAQQLAAVA